MRTKEVEKAINMTEQLQQFIKELGKDFRFYDNENSVIAYESLGILLNYISELEKENNKCEYYESVADALYKDSISKDKIRDLKEKVHKTLDANGITRAYQMLIDKDFEELLKGE